MQLFLEKSMVVALQFFFVIHYSETICTCSDTDRFVEHETRNAELNSNRNPEWSGDFSQLQIQFVVRYREI